MASADSIEVFSDPQLTDTLSEMRSLLSQSALSFLIGAGCSKAAGLPLMHDLTEHVLKDGTLSSEVKDLLSEVVKNFSDPTLATIEDYMSEVVDRLSIAERRYDKNPKSEENSTQPERLEVQRLKSAIGEIKRSIARAIDRDGLDISTHRRFASSIHHLLQAGRRIASVNYFVLNYDTLLEDALGLERVEYADGFSGAATGWWNPLTLTDDTRSARVFKLHGSIDWRCLAGDPRPVRLRPKLDTGPNPENVLIYPSASKYQETQRDPFAQMLSHFRQIICPGPGNEQVLAICGYSFGDSHVDLEIESALRRSSGRLTVAAFVSSDAPEAPLKSWLEDKGISEQVRVYTNRGVYHGDECYQHAEELPWWKFEVLTRLLAGER